MNCVKNKYKWVALLVVALSSFILRFHDLGRAAVRGDEINFLNVALRDQTVLDLWRNPPWMNQIPLAESVCAMWHNIRTGLPSEGSVREPFALMGWLTIIGATWWLMERRGVLLGITFGLWIAFLPFHVYQSREAYYYVVVMALAAGLTLYSADLFVRLRRGENLKFKQYAWWTIWATLTCLTHMSTWIVTATIWAILALQGKSAMSRANRRQHMINMGVSALILGVFMIRWVTRAILEVHKVSQASGHIGGDFGWVSARIVPFFLVGANWIGFVLAFVLLVAALAGGIGLHRKRGKDTLGDQLYIASTWIVCAGFVATLLYVGVIGGGVAKTAYFASLLPIFLIWTVLTLDRAVSLLPAPADGAVRVAIPVIIVGLLAYPAVMTTRLEGKPVPYKLIAGWLDEQLDAGSVVVVDRWFEPWNEMARYAPTNVTVTFTVPDEPLDNYQQFRWRDVTRQAIESGNVQAFIRLTRNHEAQVGLWTWPETYFARKAVIKNDAGLWLRLHGYAAHEDFFAPNTNRLIAEIFYDLKEDAIARLQQKKVPYHAFFRTSLPYEKSGPMGFLRFQTQQFLDWRVLDQRGEIEIHNFTANQAEVSLRITAVSPRGTKIVNGPDDRPFKFENGKMQTWLLGPLTLSPGINVFKLRDPLWGRSMNPLLISTLEIVAP